MITRKYLVIGAAVVLTGVGGVAAGLATAGPDASAPPPPPTWNLEDPSSVPAEFDIVGDDGKPVTCADGTPLKVPREMYFAPPPPPPVVAEKVKAAAERGNTVVVTRKAVCGPNGEAKLEETYSEEPISPDNLPSPQGGK